MYEYLYHKRSEREIILCTYIHITLNSKTLEYILVLVVHYELILPHVGAAAAAAAAVVPLSDIDTHRERCIPADCRELGPTGTPT